MKNNKKGFTLIELLAVIVILAVVALIGMTAIGPVMANSRKAALKNDGLDLISSAKTAFQAEGLKSDPKFNSTQTVCLSYAWLAANGYAELKKDYKGSVLVSYTEATSTTSSSYSYKYWVKNKEYGYAGANDGTGYESAVGSGDSKVTDAIVDACGSEAVNMVCSATTDTDSEGKLVAKNPTCAARSANGNTGNTGNQENTSN